MNLDKMRVAIVVPLRNEERNVSRLLDSLSQGEIHESEVFLIEGNSLDETFTELVRKNSQSKKHFKVMKQTYKGKFGATRTFLSLDEADEFTHVFVWDGDMTIPLIDNLRLLEVAKEYPDAFVTGSRYQSAIRNRSIPFVNFVGNILFSLLWSVITKSKPIDVLCGSKISLISDLNQLPLKLLESDYYGDIAMLFSASRNRRKIIVKKIEYVKRTHGTSNIKPFLGGFRILRAMFFCLSFIVLPSRVG